MDTDNVTFGEYIVKKRKDQGITLRGLAGMLEIAPAYLSDIEKNRRNPPERPLLEKFVSLLKISGDEKDLMFDLAGKGKKVVSPDLPDYIMSNEVVRVALRKAQGTASEEDWLKFINDLDKKGS